jgi:hypothetical protein
MVRKAAPKKATSSAKSRARTNGAGKSRKTIARGKPAARRKIAPKAKSARPAPRRSSGVGVSSIAKAKSSRSYRNGSARR